ncbi:YbfB/YjiJ family MFS transporter [Nitrogeniibacter mangrovi]|uniref:YbfB/YjiJ family MFS transporter n=1 Tax=Nitrogeniibacter mangrovi TaxID=2016596 RepID=A0A6C1B3C6_9RHOO|nr:YbfB/YjiJ family MFS transporter [Nitrogeniibacter mangrovi]QID17348.1 YbfB/YjiJ family MFS transporter [Nitrogeniibacter mangrovi]
MDKLVASGGQKNSGTRSANAVRGTLAGFCASLVGIGLARFAYTPLLPAIVDAHWFDPSQAAYLGAANLAGYLIGALAGRPIAAGDRSAICLRGMMILATVAFFACAQPASFIWFFVWRLLSGMAGGVLMVLAAPAVLPLVRPARRGLASGVIFMGVGVGIVASGTLVPLLLEQGLRDTWLGMGVISLALTAIAWNGWPSQAAVPKPHPHPRRASGNRLLRALYVEYALNAVGWVPHMIFLVDFVAHGLGKGLQVGAEHWVLFGIGATVGPVLSGMLADTVGFGRALRTSFVLEAVAVAVPACGLNMVWLMVSSVVVGAIVTGTVPLVLGRLHELLAHHPAQQIPAWSTATIGFALCQALAAYGLTFVFSASGGDYGLLFTIGSAAIVLALATDFIGTSAARHEATQDG